MIGISIRELIPSVSISAPTFLISQDRANPDEVGLAPTIGMAGLSAGKLFSPTMAVALIVTIVASVPEERLVVTIPCASDTG